MLFHFGAVHDFGLPCARRGSLHSFALVQLLIKMASSAPLVYGTASYNPSPAASQRVSRVLVLLATALGVTAGVVAFCLTGRSQNVALYAAPVTQIRSQQVVVPTMGSLGRANGAQWPMRSTTKAELFTREPSVEAPLEPIAGV